MPPDCYLSLAGSIVPVLFSILRRDKHTTELSHFQDQIITSATTAWHRYLVGGGAELRPSPNVPNRADAQFIARESSYHFTIVPRPFFMIACQAA
jgi:hypothetical protein